MRPAAPGPSGAGDLLLDGLALFFTEGRAAAVAALRRALKAFHGNDLSTYEGFRWLWLACPAASMLWDVEGWDLLSARHVQLARDIGALGMLPLALNHRAGLLIHEGEFAAAASLKEEAASIAEAIGEQQSPPLYAPLALAAFRGQRREAVELIEAGTRNMARRGEGVGLTFVHYVTAVLYNGLGRYPEALAAAKQAAEDPDEQLFSLWAAAELIEAAARSGVPEEAAAAIRRLSERTRATGGDWALGTEACARALLSDGAAAEGLFREAVSRLERTPIRMALARAHLLYGEWLRRERRRTDAREHLRSAHGMFLTMGAEGFADRAGRELLATGETARKRSADTGNRLTPQEAQVARLARDGLSNPAIGAQLFISPRTVQHHLSKVFAKLGISSRIQLDHALTDDSDLPGFDHRSARQAAPRRISDAG